MKIITKTLLLTIIIIFFPLKSFGHVEHYEKVEKFLMEIFKDGNKIGFNNYTFSRSNKNFEVVNKTEFNVSILGLNAFSIKGSSKEVYKNNKLVSFKSDTIQNKKVKFVDLYLDGSNRSYFIKGSSYTGKVDSDIIIGSWWNHKIIQTEKNISPISGSINKQTINFIKKEKINTSRHSMIFEISCKRQRNPKHPASQFCRSQKMLQNEYLILQTSASIQSSIEPSEV